MDTSSNEPLPHPIMYNNRAVTFINEGRSLDEAVRMLAHSLRSLREVMSTTNPGSNNDTKNSSYRFAYDMLPATLDDCIIPRQQVPTGTTTTTTTSRRTTLDVPRPKDDMSSCTVKQALLIPDCIVERIITMQQEQAAIVAGGGGGTITASPTEVSTYYCVASAIVMFNLALAHHLRALQVSTSTEAFSSSSFAMMEGYLRKASHLYEYCYHLCEVEGMLDRSGSVVFTLILVNNMGMVYRSLNETDKSINCFQRNLSMTMILIDSHHNNIGTGVLSSGEEYDLIVSRIPEEVFRNTMNLMYQQTSCGGKFGCRGAAAA